MHKNNGHSTIILASVSVTLFLIASKTRHPILTIAAIVCMVATYLRFRKNYVLYKRKQSKLKRQSGSIEVVTTETRESEDQNV